jgi:hypothetical protein
MHGMLPFDLPLVSQIGLQFLELGRDVSTVSWRYLANKAKSDPKKASSEPSMKRTP